MCTPCHFMICADDLNSLQIPPLPQRGHGDRQVAILGLIDVIMESVDP